jgi:hypothetical protein
MTTQAVYLVTDDKMHRGYRDDSGRFTLEQCNLAKAAEVDNLREFPTGSEDVDYSGWTLWEHCFPGEALAGRIP